MPRFSILHHDHPFLHWDLLLEWGERARTWRLLQPPALGEIEAQPLPDHRLMYLDYEGPVSGNRGNVTRWDCGQYERLSTPPHSSELQIRLYGEKLDCRLVFSGHVARFEPVE